MDAGPAGDELLAPDESYIPFRVSIAFAVLATICYAFRFWARRLQRVPFSLDDFIMVPAYIAQIALDVAATLSATYGSGRHYTEIIAENDWHFTYWGIYNLYVIPSIYLFAVTLPKLSILALYLRVFVDRFSRWCCWIIIVLLIVNVIVEYITTWLQCDHLEYAWEIWMQPGHCSNVGLHITWANLPNIVTDVAMLLLPLPAVWRLQTARHVKIGLWMTLLLGSFGLVTAILRLVAFLQGNIASDGTWYAGVLVAYTVLETSMYFISACLLTYRPLLSQLLRSFGLSEGVTCRTARSSPSGTGGRRSRLRQSPVSPSCIKDGYPRSEYSEIKTRTSNKPLPPEPVYLSA